jgi:hypothetical protein
MLTSPSPKSNILVAKRCLRATFSTTIRSQWFCSLLKWLTSYSYQNNKPSRKVELIPTPHLLAQGLCLPAVLRQQTTLCAPAKQTLTAMLSNTLRTPEAQTESEWAPSYDTDAFRLPSTLLKGNCRQAIKV